MFTFPITMMSSDGSYVIENALMLDGSADYLTFSPFVAGTSRDAWTWSMWVKRSKLGSNQELWDSQLTASPYGNDSLRFDSNDKLQLEIQAAGGSVVGKLLTTAVFRDPTAWISIVLSYNSAASATNMLRMWINGAEITGFDTDTQPSSGQDSITGIANSKFGLGAQTGGGNPFGGYLAEVIFQDGTAVTDATDFGKYDSKSVWVPVEPSGLDFGNNGFHLKFDEAALLGKSSNSTTNPTVSFLGSQVFTSAARTFTTSASSSFGDAASNRSIVIAAGGARSDAGTRTATCTINSGSGDVACTEIVRSFEGKQNCLYFFIVELASGTSGTISVTFSGGNNNMDVAGITWWRVLDAGQPISISTANADGWSSIPITNIGQNGDTTLYGLFDSGSATGFNWSDATERADHPNMTSASAPATFYGFTAADYAYSSGESHTETVSTASGSGNETSFAAITLSNNNSFVANSIAAANQVTDTCTDDDPTTGNYATLNSLDLASSTVLSNGNLRCTSSSNFFDNNYAFSTIAMSTGKFYVTSLPSDTGKYLGIANASVTTDIATANDVHIYWDSSAPRMVYWNGSNNNLTPSPTEVRGTDQLGIALNATNGDYWIGWYDISGSAWYWYNSSASNWTGNPDSDSGKSGTLSGGPYRFMAGCNASGTHDIDFGQGALWDNITELTTYKQLNTANLPAPASAASVTPLTGTFTGNGNADGPVVYLGYKPDTSATSTINSNTITWGTHADALANGMKLRTGASSYNTSGSNSYSIAVAHPFGGVGINQAKSG